MESLHLKLERWVHDGIITTDQARAILDHERRAHFRNWGILGMAGIGVVAFVTGVFSLVAGNWETISATSKIIAYFMIQAGLGAMFLAVKEQKGIWRETSLVLFALFFLAGISLVVQIYNLKTDGWRVLLFWIALILPSTLLARNRVMYHLWVLGLLGTVFFWLGLAVEGAPHLVPFASMLTIGLVYLVFFCGIWRFPAMTLPDGFRHACLTWSVLLLLAGVTTFANLLWYQDSVRETLSRFPSLGSYLIIPWIVCGLACLALSVSQPGYHAWFRGSAIGMLVAICFYLSVPIVLDMGEQKGIGCLGFTLVWALAAAAAAFSRRTRLFDLATLVIAIRFIVVYLELYEDATQTGIGLMISGALVLCLAFLWYRYRRRVEEWLSARV